MEVVLRMYASSNGSPGHMDGPFRADPLEWTDALGSSRVASAEVRQSSLAVRDPTLASVGISTIATSASLK